MDTTVVIDAIERMRPTATELFAFARAGQVDVAMSTRLEVELVRHSLDEVRALLGGREPLVLGLVARWDMSTWDGADYWGSGAEVIVAAGAMDSDHLEAHRSAGRDYFVSNDVRLQKAATRVGIAVLTPEQVIDLIDSPAP